MAQCYNSTLSAGETWQRTFTWQDPDGEPINNTGYTASMTFKKGTSTLLELTSGSGIVLGGSAGTFAVTISATQSTDFPSNSVLNYDLWVTSPGDVVTKLVCGELSVLPD